MKILKVIFLLGFWAAGFLTACTKTATGTIGPSGPVGPAGSNASDTPNAIAGYINLIDQYGIGESSNAGVTVSTHVGSNVVSATSDATGKFRIPGIPIGNYDLTFKMNGFDSLMVHVQNSGGSEDKFIDIIKMNEHLTTKIQSETLSLFQGADYIYDSMYTVQFNISFDGPALSATTRRDFGFYLSRSSSVNSNNYDLFDNTYGTSLSYYYGGNIFIDGIALANFKSRGIIYNTGDTVYVKTYSLPVTNLTTWFNYSTYQTVNYPYTGDSSLNYFIWK